MSRERALMRDSMKAKISHRHLREMERISDNIMGETPQGHPIDEICNVNTMFVSHDNTFIDYH